MKKALIYDPYLDTLGGGERYVLTFAQALSQIGYLVDLAWSDITILDSAKKRFNLDLSSIKIKPSSYSELSLSSGLFKRYHATKNYDLTFWVSDGSLPTLFGRKNFIHFQVPFTLIGGNLLTNLLKTGLINKFIFNSAFTSAVVKSQLPFSSTVVLYPPIDTGSFTGGKKEKVILSVARFDSPSHAKRQDVLIDAFGKFYKQNKDFKLILSGGLKSDNDYLDSLKKQAGNLPIEFIPNPNFSDLKRLYAKALFFWHAAGYGIDEKIEPEKVEHFGMTTVEAMSAGAVPVVIDKGGQREIVTGETGYLCDSVDEIVASTLSLINSPDKLKIMSQNSVSRAKDFSIDRFILEVKKITGS